MKKNLLTLAAVLCCALISSCTKDNGDIPPPAPDNKPTHAVMHYVLTVNDQMVDMLNLTIEYYDANGQVKSEQVTQNKWQKDIKAKLPANLGARLKVQLKDGADPSTLEKFTASYNLGYNVYVVNASGETVGKNVFDTIVKSLDMKGTKVEDWIASKSDGLVKFLLNIDANGEVTKDTWK